MGLTLKGRLGTAAVFLVFGAAWSAVIRSWVTQPRESTADEAAAVGGTLAMAAWTVVALACRARPGGRASGVKVWGLVLGTGLSGLTALGKDGTNAP